MASKVKVDIKVDDKGSLKQVAKNARTADRNLKGAARTSSNSTKNFSKMAQGMSGTLVPAYATLAANIFAISAAFRFLKDAGDLKTMQQGQLAFAATTGVAMRTLTKDIREAAGGMLEFEEAAQAASIGIASGLNQEQIVKLGEGAAHVSKILGRDVTDSFNRLVKGVTKAEPELLDELGITLRLADAKEKYAASINKTADALTMFEQKQAVFNEVAGQLEEKFGRINKILSPDDNPFVQLGVAFDDVLLGVKEFVATIGTPIAKFFTKNIGSLTAALALMAIPIIKAVIPGLDKWAEKAEDASRRASDAYKIAHDKLAALHKKKPPPSSMPGYGGAAGALEGIDTRKGSGAEKLQKGQQLSKRNLTAMIGFAKEGVGVITQIEKKKQQIYIRSLEIMNGATLTTTEKIKRAWKSTTTYIGLQTQKMKARWQGAMASMKVAAANFAKFTTKIFKLAGWIGIIIMLKDLAMAAAKAMGFFKSNEALDEFNSKLGELNSNLTGVIEEFQHFVDVQDILQEKTITTSQGLAALGGLVSGMSKDFTSMNTMVQENVQVLTDSEVKLNKVAEAWSGVPILELWANWAPGISLLQEYTGLFDDIDTKMQGWISTNADFTDEQLEAMEALKKSARAQIEAVEAIKWENNALAEEYIDLNEKLERQGYLNKENAKRYKELAEEIKTVSAEVANMIRLNTDNAQGMTKVIAGLTKYKTSTTDLTNAMVEQIQTEFKNRTAGWQDRVLTRKKEIEILELISDKEFKFAMLRKSFDRIHVEAARDATKFQKQELGIMKKMGNIDLKRAEVLNEIAIIAKSGQKMAERVKEDYAQQLALLEAQKGALKDQLELTWQLKMAMANAFESSLADNIGNIIKGQESSFSDAILNIAKATLSAAADVMAKEITGWITKAVGLKTPEQRMEEGMNRSVDKHRAAVEEVLTTTVMPPLKITGLEGVGEDIAKAMTGTAEGIGNTIAEKIKAAVTAAEAMVVERKRIDKLNTSIATRNAAATAASEDRNTGWSVDNATREGTTPLDLSVDNWGRGNAPIHEKKFDIWTATNKEAGEAIVSAVSAGAELTVDGIGGLKAGLGNMIGGLLTSKSGGGGGGGFMAFIKNMAAAKFGLPTGNSGGYATKKGFRSFGQGGIVPGRGNRDSVPAMLTPGEIVTNPARGQHLGQSNNVTVNVSVDSNGNAQTQTRDRQGEKMAEMGKLISGAVTEELLRQKRPGGILSPYGGGT